MTRRARQLAVALLAFPASAAASGNHHSAPMGGRSALMGGTGVALGVDGAAPFLNPATITRIGAGRLAFSSRFYRYSVQRLHDFHQPGPVDPALFAGANFQDTDRARGRLHSVPDSVCYFFSAVADLSRGQRLSICLATTEEQELSLRALGFQQSSAGYRIDQNEEFDVDWSRLNIGPTWGFAVNADLALGASLLVSYSRYAHSITASTVIEEVTSGAASVSNYESHVSASSWDLAPRIGATYQLSRPLTLGIGLTLPVAHLFGGMRETYMDEFGDARQQWSGDGDFSAKPPPELRLGIGAAWETVRFEADVFVTAGTSDYARGSVERSAVVTQAGAVTSRTRTTAEIGEAAHPVVNLALGAEVFVAPRLSLLAGAQTDVNALDELDPAEANRRLFRTRLDYYRAGVGVCSYTDFGDLLFGLRFDYGTGEASPVNALVAPPALGRADVTELGFMVVLAGIVNWGTISQAAGHVGEAVRGRAGRPPSEPPQPFQPPKQE